jgi:polysaccharide deacetylase 2 family uncharacterized protein YibQ
MYNHSDKKMTSRQDQKELLEKVKNSNLSDFVDAKTISAARPNRIDIRAAVRKRGLEEKKDKRTKISDVNLRDRLNAARAKHP